MMKTLLFSFFLISFTLKLYSQPQCYSASDNNYTISHQKLSADQFGNLFETGSFQGSVTIGGTTYTSAGGNDLYIVMYDMNQNLIWSMTAGGIGHEDNRGGAVADMNGNVYVGGSFQSPTFILGNDTLYNADITGLTPNVFLFKMDLQGNILWSRSTNTFSVLNDLATDDFGNIYITGAFRDSPVTFGNLTLNHSGASSSTDTYLVSYDSAGNVLWAKRSDCTNNDAGVSIDADDSHVYLCGLGNNCSIGFDGISALNSSGNNTYLAKFDHAGNPAWVMNTNNASSNNSYPVMFTDGSGNTYVGGNFNSPSLTFDNVVFNNNGSGGNDGFIAKVDSGGNVLWGKVIGGISDDGYISLSYNGMSGGSVAGAYYFSSPSITIGTNTHANLGLTDIVFFEYDANGNDIWSELLGGPGDEWNTGFMMINASGYLYGGYNDSAFSLGSCSLSGMGNFLARFDFPFQNINSPSSKQHISVFPDPAVNQINVKAEDIIDIELVDLSGRMISKFSPGIVTDSYTVDVSSYLPGIYMLRIFSDKHVSSTKFVKQ